MFKKNRVQLHVGLALALSSQLAFSACTSDGVTLNCSEVTIWSDNTAGTSAAAHDKVIITSSTTATISGLKGWGIYSAGNPMTFKDLDISTTGAKSDGIITKNGTTSIVVDKLTITTTGDSADGINLGKESQNTTITVGDNAYIDARGMGVRANTSANATGENLITLGKNATITTSEDGSNFEFSLFGSVYEFGTGYGVYAGNTSSTAIGNARVVMGDNSSINTLGANAHAVYANKAGVIELGSTVITANGTGSHGVYAEAGQTGGGLKGSQIYLLGDASITAKGTSKYALYAEGGGSTIASYDPHSGQPTSGIYTVNGNMNAENGGKIDLNMANGSAFLGNTQLTGTDATLNLAIDGPSSQWTMDSSSELTTLALTQGAQVYLTDQSSVITNETTANNIVLTMENLRGTGGIFHMRTDILGTNTTTGSLGDLIKVTGTSEGQHKIFINDGDNGSIIADGTERLKVVETDDGVAEFALLNASGTVDIGAYAYGLGRGDTSDGTGYENWWLTYSPKKTNAADISSNFLNISYLLSNVENQTLLQRLGEIRRSASKEGDMWIRGYGGKLSSFQDASLSGFDMNYHGVQIGVDKYVGRDIYVGMMMGTAKADVDYNIGKGTTSSHHLGLYGTYKADNGWYVDSIAKLVYMKSQFDTLTGSGFAVQGNGNSHGYSLGVEAGKRFYLQEADSGFYLEPQAQFTYSHQNSATVKATNGLKTRLDEFDSMIGRVSAIIGYSIVDEVNPIDIYLKTGYVKEFDGKTGYTFNDTIHEKYKFNGNWWDNGIGISAQIKSQHNVYIEADYSVGDKFDKKQINVGYRYAF